RECRKEGSYGGGRRNRAPSRAGLRGEERAMTETCVGRFVAWAWVAVACLTGAGCCTPEAGCVTPLVPRELAKVSHPTYVIAPPDILLITPVRLAPKPPYRIAPLDSVLIRATNVLAEDPIAGLYTVTPEGTVNLGQSYGSVQVVGMKLDEAQ